ncbi:MAG: hypothetical protein LC792_07480 [Actinobacteria bacterium]|nr:hypothetical protein [Actinomycetota bacterium]
MGVVVVVVPAMGAVVAVAGDAVVGGLPFVGQPANSPADAEKAMAISQRNRSRLDGKALLNSADSEEEPT